MLNDVLIDDKSAKNELIFKAPGSIDVPAKDEKVEARAEAPAEKFKFEEKVIVERPLNYLDEIIDIKNQIEGDAGEQLGNPALYNDFIDHAESDLEDDKISINDRLKKTADRVNRFHSLQVHSLQVSTGVYTQYALETGKILLRLQCLCEGAISKKQISNPSWAHWAVRNLRIPKTTRDKYMRLARNADAQDFSYLGTELLLELISQTEEWVKGSAKAEGEIGNEIGRFLLTNGVFFTSFREKNDFRGLIDEITTCVLMQKLKDDGFSGIRRELVYACVKGGYLTLRLPKEMLELLVALKKDDQDLNPVFETVITCGGFFSEKADKKHRRWSFRKVAANMNETVLEVLAKPEKLQGVEEKDVQMIMTNLQRLLTEVRRREPSPKLTGKVKGPRLVKRKAA